MEPGEDSLEAAQRELLEEAGLGTTYDSPIDSYRFTNPSTSEI
jgi:8-oxo-dGTP pyrophosphatase MutT (NUDIX family)